MEFQYEVGFLRKDSAESIFFTRELTKVQARSYDVLYPELKGRMFLFVDNADMSPGDEVGIYETYDSFGMAQWISSNAKDLPRVDVKGSETTYRVYSFGNSYGYTLTEILKAQATGKPLEQRRVNAARAVAEQFIDDVMLSGSTTKNILGIANQTNALDYAAPNNAANTSATWANKSGDEILKDMNGMIQKITQTSKGVEQPNRMLLPQSLYELITSKRVNPGFNNDTILKAFLANAPAGFRVDSWYKLETASGSSGKLAICYNDSKEKIQGVVTQEFTSLPPQTEGFETVVYNWARTGGVICYYPASICYCDDF